MRRLSVLIIVTLALLCCSCTNFSLLSPPERITEFSSFAEISFGDKSFSGKISCLSPECISFTFSEPEGISGVSVRTDENGFFCDIHGAGSDIPYELLRNDSCAVMLFEAVRCAVFSPADMTKNSNGDFTTDVLNGKYSAVFSPDGKLKLITSVNADPAFYAAFSYT